MLGRHASHTTYLALGDYKCSAVSNLVVEGSCLPGFSIFFLSFSTPPPKETRTNMPTTRVPLIFGGAAIGKPKTLGIRIDDLEEAQRSLNVFFDHGHTEIDTAR